MTSATSRGERAGGGAAAGRWGRRRVTTGTVFLARSRRSTDGERGCHCARTRGFQSRPPLMGGRKCETSVSAEKTRFLNTTCLYSTATQGFPGLPGMSRPAGALVRLDFAVPNP